MCTSVTFDSNVWEIIVDDDKRKISDLVFTHLFSLIQSGVIKPYFCETTVVMEGIPKADRKNFIVNYKLNYSLSVDGHEIVSPDNSDAFEVSDYHKRIIPEALELGFKFIGIPRIGAVKLENFDQYFASDEKYEMSERIRRSHNCAEFIESLGGGQGALIDQLSPAAGGVVQKTKADNVITNKKYSKKYSEWADGDALAASYGYGIDYFCTNDKASKAGTSSIFHSLKLAELEKNYPVNVISPHDLAAKFCMFIPSKT